MSPNNTHTIHLAAASTLDIPGQFEGVLQLYADGAAAAQSLPLTVYVTNKKRRVGGFLLILSGIAVAWYVSVFFKVRAARIAGLLPAARLREAVDALASRIDAATKATEVTFDTIGAAIKALKDELSDTTITLEGFVPGPIPSPFGSSGPNRQDYKAYLDARAGRIARLTLIERSGIACIIGHWGSIAGREDDVRPFLHDLDAVATQTDAAQVKARVDATIQTFNQVLEEVRTSRSAVQSTSDQIATQAESLSTEALAVELTSISVIVWLIWAVVTAVTGWGALILSNPGFGTSMDLLQCLLWGLGVQVAGQQLQQLSPATVASSFRILLPAKT